MRFQIVATSLLTLALVYGANLYFSINGNINDPQVALWVPLAKDFVLIAAMAAAAWRLRAHAVLPLPFIALGAFCLYVGIGVIITSGINGATLSIVKNLGAYLFMGGLVALMLVGRMGMARSVDAVAVALAISFAAGFLMLAHSVQSLDGRFYGTYGNPTSLGFAGLVFAGLMLWRGNERDVYGGAVICALLASTTGSASVLLGGAALYAGSIALNLAGKQEVLPAVAGLIVFLGGFVILSTGSAILGAPSFGYLRLMELVSDPGAMFSSDSVRIRISDLAAAAGYAGYHRYDSFLLSVWRGVGLIPVGLYAAFVALAAWAYFRSDRSHGANVLAALFFVVFVINPALQHQAEVFPTNLLFSVVAALSVAQWRSRPRTSQ